MVGDQIYADKFNRMLLVGRADSFEEFQERYHTAYKSLSMRRLLSSVPTYMVLDDHEIEDNWTQDRVSSQSGRQLFFSAIRAYLSYQWSHGPRSYSGRLYYRFECDGYPVFVLDTRTQRYVDDIADSLADNHLLGRPSRRPDREQGQLERLLGWLTEQQAKVRNAPKFIVTSSVFLPNTVASTKGDRYRLKEDDWSAFPQTRRAVLSHVVSGGIQNVVFLAGDIHCSNVAEMTFAGPAAAAAIKAFAVTSSAFYWPFPFADGDPADYVHDSTDDDTPDTFDVGGGVAMNYTARAFTQEDNFCRLDVDQATHSLTVRVFDWQGQPVQDEAGPLTSVLPLVAW
jgi:alkaline phosphatase D